MSVPWLLGPCLPYSSPSTRLHSHLGDLNCGKARDAFAMPLLINGTPNRGKIAPTKLQDMYRSKEVPELKPTYKV